MGERARVVESCTSRCRMGTKSFKTVGTQYWYSTMMPLGQFLTLDVHHSRFNNPNVVNPPSDEIETRGAAWFGVFGGGSGAG